MAPPQRSLLRTALADAYAVVTGHTAPAALIDALTDAALAALLAGADPRQNPNNVTLAELCRREHLPLPPADQVGDPEALVMRGYQLPTALTPHWTITNTGGRRYRFHADSPEPTERYRGTAWEDVPPHQEPAIVVKLRQALMLAATSGCTYEQHQCI